MTAPDKTLEQLKAELDATINAAKITHAAVHAAFEAFRDPSLDVDWDARVDAYAAYYDYLEALEDNEVLDPSDD